MGKASKKSSRAVEETALDVDIEALRDEFESTSEWRLRKKFLQSNVDSLSLDRLICLSRCFVNMTEYQCKYPEAVMVEIHERSAGILDEVEIDKKTQAKQDYTKSFVKASYQ